MRIGLRTKKLGYSVATLGCLAGSALAFVATQDPVDDSIARSAGPLIKDIRANATDAAHAPSREELIALCNVRLRRPLYDPPPPRPVVKELPPLQVEVLGTILEDTNSVALVRGAQGGMEYKRVGDSVGPADSPARLIEITDTAITVERGQERVTLRVNNSERH